METPPDSTPMQSTSTWENGLLSTSHKPGWFSSLEKTSNTNCSQINSLIIRPEKYMVKWLVIVYYGQTGFSTWRYRITDSATCHCQTTACQKDAKNWPSQRLFYSSILWSPSSRARYFACNFCASGGISLTDLPPIF